MSKRVKKRLTPAKLRRSWRRGLIAALALTIAATGLGVAALLNWGGPNGMTADAVAGDQSPFDGERAYRDLRTILALGPRVSDTPASAKMRAYIRQEMSKAGLEVKELTFDASTPFGKKTMTNMVGVVKGDRDDIIIIGNHYDTKYFPDFEFVGANDGGSTTAWMIEMARTLGPKRNGASIWLTFFDGEEAFKDWTATDSLYGSREFVRYLRDAALFGKVKAMVNVDMIGDCQLGIHPDPDAAPWLIAPVWKAAKTLGYDKHFLTTPLRIEDDHVPFKESGIPTLELIDFAYGGSSSDHQRNWHTSRDTIDLVCAASLQVVGDVIYHAIPKWEAYLAEHR